MTERCSAGRLDRPPIFVTEWVSRAGGDTVSIALLGATLSAAMIASEGSTANPSIPRITFLIVLLGHYHFKLYLVVVHAVRDLFVQFLQFFRFWLYRN